MRYNNYHKHDHISNISSPDTNTKAEEYIKKCVEYGHTNYFTTNHGHMGDVFEAKTLCEKYGIRCLAGLEGYIVPNPLEKDKSNYHIIIIPRTNKARKKVNLISSRANIEGFYYKPRIFLEDLLKLDKDDVYITTACVAGLLRDDRSINELFYPLYEHFKDHMFLEIQSHDEIGQKTVNQKALELHNKLGVKLIAANDSHYVNTDGQKERLELLKGKHINYGDEDTYILDFPTAETMIERFEKQGVIPKGLIIESINNTLIFDECEEIDIDRKIKMPSIHKDLTPKERVDLLKKIINKEFTKIRKKENIFGEELQKYKDGIKYEMKIIEDTNDVVHTADYFLFNYKNVDLAVNKYDGVLTRGGRGSCASFYINRILGMTQLDRFKINLPIFPDRFASTARLLENMALPDVDFNVKSQEPFVSASRELLGEHGCYPMIAYGCMQMSEAFRNVCRSKDIPHDEYNEVAKNIEDYLEDERWKPIIEEANKYVGTVVSASVHPCAHLLYDGNLMEEYGVIRVGENICVMITSLEADEYKFLKNDYLIVKVWKLIDETFKEIGIPIIDANELLGNIKNNNRVWDLFKNGITCTLNQVDSDNGMHQAKRYGISSFEDGAFIAAAIRPSFDSWRESFLNREDYSTGSKDLDNILSMTGHYILFQENLMQYFEWLGVTPAESIGLIKKISKKKIKPDDFVALEERLKKEWINKTGSDYMFVETWKMIQSCISYGFASPHAAATSLDMCYGAYLKVNYPLEYYTVCFNNYSDDEVRTRKLKKELDYFNIGLEDIKFRYAKAEYSFDKNTNTIYKGVSSIKFLNKNSANELYELRDNKYNSFVDLLYDIKEKTSVNSRQLDILIKLDYFSEFGEINKLLKITEIFETLHDKSQFKKDKLSEFNLAEEIVRKHSGSETETRVDEIDCKAYLNNHGISEDPDCMKYKYVKDEFGKTKDKIPNGYSTKKTIKKYQISNEEQEKYATKIVVGRFSEIDMKGLLSDIFNSLEVPKCSISDKLKYQKEHLGYINMKLRVPECYYYITNIDGKYSNKVVTLYQLKTGTTVTMKVKGKTLEQYPLNEGDIINIVESKEEQKWGRKDGEYYKKDEYETVLKKYNYVR